MNISKLFSRPVLYIVIGLYFVVGFATLAFGEKAAALLFDEDRYFENIGAISLFIAAGISFYTFYLVRKAHQTEKVFWGKQLVYLGMALLYFFGGGEEISWGQRIFGIETPEALMETNTQEEINIHNLAFWENSEILKSDDIFSIYWFGFVVIVPAASYLFGWFKKLASMWMPIVHWGIGVLFLFNYFFAKVAKSLFASYYTYQTVPFIQAVQEVKESNYEFMFIFLSLWILWDFMRSSQSNIEKNA